MSNISENKTLLSLSSLAAEKLKEEIQIYWQKSKRNYFKSICQGGEDAQDFNIFSL